MASMIFATLFLFAAVGSVISGPLKTCAIDKGKCDTDKYVTCGEVTVNGWVWTTKTVNVVSLDDAQFKKSGLSLCATEKDLASENEVINADGDTGFGSCHHTCERKGKTETVNCVKALEGRWFPYRAKTSLLTDLPGGKGTNTQMMYAVFRTQMDKNAQADKNAQKGECSK